MDRARLTVYMYYDFESAIMTYKTVPAERETQEIFHLILHCVALVAGSIGIYAVFKSHNELSIPEMNTLHSWIGMSTFCLFGLKVPLCSRTSSSSHKYIFKISRIKP